MKTVKIGFIMGFGIGLMTVSAIMFAVAMSDLNKTENTKIKENQKSTSVIKEDNTEVPKEIKKETEGETKVEQEDTSDTAKLEESEKEIISIIIPKGSDSFAVARILYDNKLIENENNFQVYLEKQNKGTLLQYGTFNIKQGSSYDDIIKKIT
ncbi:MAG TPA: hypothetical protein DEP72_09040 [Clostridiales bacterium]|nr:MAG: hypothetical protein A2Y18_05970 [Clostridiales bacterium GWD2_32_19]HCC08284.1 hypothetical protein [Clostridiales bacterium]